MSKKKNRDTDRPICEIKVLWSGWECDEKAWVMERPDGSRYIKGGVTNKRDLESKIKEYGEVLFESNKALELLRR